MRWLFMHDGSVVEMEPCLKLLRGLLVMLRPGGPTRKSFPPVSVVAGSSAVAETNAVQISPEIVDMVMPDNRCP